MIKKNWLWVVLTLLSFGLHTFFYTLSPAEAIEKSAQLGTMFLLLVLIPKNLTMWLPQDFVMQPLLKKLVVWRRDLGIVSGILFALHGITAMATYGNFQMSYFFDKAILPGFIALIIVYGLLLTSSSWSLRVLKQMWGKIQSLIWVAVPLVLLHSIIATMDYRGEYSTIGLIGFGGLIMLACIEAYFFAIHADRPVNNKWKHIRLIVIGSVLALLIFFFYPDKR